MGEGVGVKPEEEAAREWLVSLGFQDPVYEPDGNVPPDFVVSGGIAVEVRRLNRLVWDGSRHVGPETLEYGLLRRVERVLAGYRQPTAGLSHSLEMTYRRPFRLGAR